MHPFLAFAFKQKVIASVLPPKILAGCGPDIDYIFTAIIIRLTHRPRVKHDRS